MKIFYCTGILLFISILCSAQTQVEWHENIEITEESFQGELPNLAEDNVQQYSFAATFEFNFAMLNIQFTFTKNFNKYVTSYYIPSDSWIEEGELTPQLLAMANLDFDLIELYARKFRKRMYESKNAGSNVNFFSVIHQEINREYVAKQAEIQSRLRGVTNSLEFLTSVNADIDEEILELSEFCKTCKPKKKKK